MMDLEAKAKLGKEVMGGLAQGVAFEIVMSHIVLTCMKAGETELEKVVVEVLVLGLNEYAIDTIEYISWGTYISENLSRLEQTLKDVKKFKEDFDMNFNRE